MIIPKFSENGQTDFNALEMANSLKSFKILEEMQSCNLPV